MEEEVIEKKKSFRFLNILLFIVILSLGAFMYSKYLGVKGLITYEYRVDSDILSSNFSGAKIIHISDLLYGSSVNNDDLDRLVKKVNYLKPDIIVFTGDMVHSSYKMNDKSKDKLIETFKNMNATLGKYAIKGENDYNDYYEDIIKNSNFTLLNNSYEKIYYKDNNYIYITGLPSMIKEDINLDDAFSFYSDENRKYTICLIHEGNIINKINDSDYEVDLILGGHSLNGSVIIPYYGSLFIPKESSDYYAHEYQKGITNIFISSGIGTLDYPYRFLNKPSINLYRLKKTN